MKCILMYFEKLCGLNRFLHGITNGIIEIHYVYKFIFKLIIYNWKHNSIKKKLKIIK